jgi:hypothetical protein
MAMSSTIEGASESGWMTTPPVTIRSTDCGGSALLAQAVETSRHNSAIDRNIFYLPVQWRQPILCGTRHQLLLTIARGAEAPIYHLAR